MLAFFCLSVTTGQGELHARNNSIIAICCWCTVCGVLFSPLWLKSVPDWPAVSVSTSQQFRVGQIVWFGCLSAVSQLASRVGEGGGVWQLCLHSVTQPTLPAPGGESREGGCVPSPWFLHMKYLYILYYNYKNAM
jgi:hypothetical protein